MGACPKNGLGGAVDPFSAAFLPDGAVVVLGLTGPLALVPGTCECRGQFYIRKIKNKV